MSYLLSETIEVFQPLREASKWLRLPDAEIKRLAPMAAIELGQSPVSPAANIAALAFCLPRHPTRHVIRPSAAAAVRTTTLGMLPAEPPALLRAPGICEVRRPALDRIVGDVVALGWYELEGVLYIVTLHYPDGALGFGVAPGWGTDRIDQRWHTWPGAAPREQCEAISHWLLTFACLLDADRQPLEVTVEDDPGRPKRGKRGKRADRGKSGWITRRYVYLEQHQRPRAQVSSSEGSGISPELVSELTDIAGHLKWQRHGAGGQERKLIYIKGYKARRYFAPGAREVIVQDRPRQPSGD